MTEAHEMQLPAPPDAVIAAERLTKTYDGRNAVDSLSFVVQRGEVYGLLGPNGAGKTTTLRLLLGLIAPSSGSATVLGAAPGSAASLSALGALVEEPALYPYLSGRDNLRLVTRYCAIEDTRIDAALDLVGLLSRQHDKVRTYSLGMRQRLGVAAALVKDPEVLILDEPTNGLDPQGMAQMRGLIRQLGSGSRTVLLSSHLLGEVEQVCDRVGVLRQGVLVAEGAITDLRGQGALEVVATPIEQAENVLTEAPEVASVRREGERLRVTAPIERAADLNAALVHAGIAVSKLAPIQRSLEDVFLDLTADQQEVS